VIVVADTSVILNLCCVGQHDLLSSMFREVVIPPEVQQEFERAACTYPRFAKLTVPAWIRQQQPQALPQSLLRVPNLDAGETAAIALALELAADAVLIDETIGRQVACQHGLTTIGLLGILIRARQFGLLPAITPVVNDLERKANFWLKPEIRLEALRLVGEAN
jgi:uncharacterized protein